MFSSQTVSNQTVNHVDDDNDKSSLAERRRSSLRTMRQCLSLPHPTSGSTLRMLIESRVRLPVCSAQPGYRRRETITSDRGDFFLEIVRDVSCELDFGVLTRKMLVNLSALASAEYASIYMLDASRTWSGADARRPRLTVRSYDARDGIDIDDDDDRYSLTTEDASSLTAAWGHGLVGYVAEMGVVVRLVGNSSNTVTNLFLKVKGKGRVYLL